MTDTTDTIGTIDMIDKIDMKEAAIEMKEEMKGTAVMNDMKGRKEMISKMEDIKAIDMIMEIEVIKGRIGMNLGMKGIMIGMKEIMIEKEKGRKEMVLEDDLIFKIKIYNKIINALLFLLGYLLFNTHT